MNDAFNDREIWFPAKRYGWGWGIPVRWQGWVVLLLYTALMTVAAVVLAASERWILFASVEVLLTAALVFICYWKGEKPRWRWGD
jgi:hypothetical protein